MRSRGLSILYAPPYCPECNPIENVFSLIKRVIRQHAPVTPHRSSNEFMESVSNAVYYISEKIDASLFSFISLSVRQYVERLRDNPCQSNSCIGVKLQQGVFDEQVKIDLQKPSTQCVSCAAYAAAYAAYARQRIKKDRDKIIRRLNDTGSNPRDVM